MINGIINVYKEAGYTSHDVVAKMRGIFKQKKIGHTGTLDPAATGVLPVCMGKATKVCDLLTDKDKSYRCVMLLGRVTDTQDTTGQILEEKEVSLTEQNVTEAIMSFVGTYDQIPPMYSALKVNGKKLYELARAGQEVERKPRRVCIPEIRIEGMDLPRVTMTVTCSKGTYIRTLCHDIGTKLGCGGCMEQLTRVRVADFSIEKSLTLGQLEAAVKEDRVGDILIPVDSIFGHYPAVIVDERYRKALDNGNRIPLEGLEEWKQEWEAQPVRVYDRQHHFAGIYQYQQDAEVFGNSMEDVKNAMNGLAGAIEAIAQALSGINDTVGESSIGVTDIAAKTSSMVEKTGSTQDMVEDCYHCVENLREIVGRFMLDQNE